MALSSIASVIVDYIDSGIPGLDLTAGVNMFIGHLIPNPDNATMFFDGGGPQQDMYLDTSYATIEIWTRDRDSAVGYDRLLQIFEKLHRLGNVQLGRYYLYFLHATSNILDMDRDQEGRKLYKITFRAIYRDTNVIS